MHARPLFTIARPELDRLIRHLRSEGFRVVGPTVRDGAIIYDELNGAADLPIGWKDEQSPGRYRLQRRGDDACFGYVLGPHSWKKYLFPPRHRLFSLTREGREIPGFQLKNSQPPAPRYAFLGVRACELAALEVQDRVLNAELADPYYAEVRRQALVIAVNCGEPGGTCFCASQETGPRCTRGFDLALTELPGAFVVEVGSPRGQALLDQLEHRAADANERRLVELTMHVAVQHMGRQLDTRGLRAALRRHPEHPHWQRVAERCLACANCTLVCPTCFCSSIEDSSDLAGVQAERIRSWGSCFTLEFSYHTGGYGRSSIRARYRQWLTHKLASWYEQFGCSGCVGCGRCITWCPVGIDLTAEAGAILEDVRRSETPVVEEVRS
jgi:sulfhydrogenase subunit beta (sulfur reductase)